MTTLKSNWYYEGNLDFEHKKYLFLAYLQYVNKHFKESMLYPTLAELVEHYKSIHFFLNSKERMQDGFPKKLESIDMKKLKVVYKKVLEQDNILETIERLARYASPRIKEYLNNGKEIYDFIEDNLNLYEVGVMPLQKDEGYMILCRHRKDQLVYRYAMSVFSAADEKYRSLKLHFVKSYKYSISHTLNSIKQDLLDAYRWLPNPATYAIESEIKVPVRETLLPIAKRKLMAHLSHSK